MIGLKKIDWTPFVQVRNNGGWDSHVGSGGSVKWLNFRDLREKTWQGYEMSGHEGEESVRHESSICIS